MTSDDLLAWLHPFCGDAALPVRPRIDVLQILESNFSLRDSDVRLLLLYRTQAVLKGREVTRCARKRSGGRGSSAPLEESAGMRYLRNNFTTLPLDSMGARDGSFFFFSFSSLRGRNIKRWAVGFEEILKIEAKGKRQVDGETGRSVEVIIL